MTETKIVKVDPLKPDENYLKEAADILATGGLVIIPTETVYGIAANMLNKEAMERLSNIKKRSPDKPFSLHIESKEKVAQYAQDIPIAAWKLIDKFWPGPLTLVLKSKEGSSIGLRLPDDQAAVKIITLADVPVVCPSANLAGEPAPTDFSAAFKDLNGLVDFAIDSGPTKLKLESSVVDLTTAPLRILREGAIKKEEIETVANKKTVLFVCTGNSCRSVMAEGLLKKKLQEKGRADVEVLSAGIMMLSGAGATEQTKELLMREGIDVSRHLSRRVTQEMINKADIILVMEKLHEERILQLVPEVKNRVFLLKEFAKINDNNLNIEDPIGKPVDFYEQIFVVIKEAIERISDII